jgi:hypothetical protein
MSLVADKYSENYPVPCSIDALSVTEIRDELKNRENCVLFRQSDICIGDWDWRSWTLVSNCAFAVFFL